jgi:hypothetical protein
MVLQDEHLRAGFTFYKANIDDEGLAWWAERQGITTLPHLTVWSPAGAHLAGMTSSAQRMEQVGE